MDPNARKIEIEHGDPCRCTVDGNAIYVRMPCRVVGHHITKRRIGQMLHALRRRSTRGTL